MAEWALHYLINTPRPHLDYEPVFQCHPLTCPPVPDGHDVIVPCDTDARMEWEWYYMREISGSDAGRDVERAFHRRMRAYVEPDGTVLAPPGCYNEADIHARFERSDYVYHVWGCDQDPAEPVTGVCAYGRCRDEGNRPRGPRKAARTGAVGGA